MADKMDLSMLIFCLFSSIPVISASVPILLWGNKDVEQIKSPAGQTVSNDIVKPMLDSLAQKDENLLVFLQDKLSMDDITKNADVYNLNSDGALLHNLKTLMQDFPSSHMPRVSSPSETIDDLKRRYGGSVHDLHPPYAVSQLPLAEDNRNLIIVHLPQKSDSQDTNLAAADGIIGSVTRDMRSLGKAYSAIYTGKESSKVNHNSLFMGRHLLQVADASNQTRHFYNVSSCIYFFAENMVLNITKSTGTATTYNLKEADSSDSKCVNGTEAILNLKFTNNDNIQMKIVYNKTKDGYWTISEWTTTYDSGASTLKFKFGDIFAPLGYSYHCTDPVIKNGTSSLMVKNFQTQAYMIKGDQFGTANDCVGFFTIPIWMGIIVTLVLISILTFGVALLSNINTMDRFDDPKGKTISVNVAD